MRMMMLVLYDPNTLDDALDALASVQVLEIGVFESETVQRCRPQRFAARRLLGMSRVVTDVRGAELIILGLMPDEVSMDVCAEAIEARLGPLDEGSGLVLSWDIGYLKGRCSCIVEGEA